MEEAAARLGEPGLLIEDRTWNRWASGERRPRRYATFVAEAFQLPSEELGFAPLPLTVPDESRLVQALAQFRRLDETERRRFLRLTVAMLGPTAFGQLAPLFDLEAWERLGLALQRPGRWLDAEALSHLERVTVTLGELEPQLSPHALLGPTLGHLETLARLLQENPADSASEQLWSLSAETAGLAGWLLWDLDERRGAGAYFRRGLRAAREAGDPAIGAYLMGSAAVQPSTREKPQVRLRLLDGRTFGFTQRDATPATRAWLATLEAEAHVLAGDEARARRALERAQTAATATEESSPRPRRTFFDGLRMAGEVGVCLARLGRSAEAVEVLKPVLDDFPPTQLKTRPRLLAALATAYVEQEAIEQACQLGTEALDLAVEQQVQPNLADVIRLRQRLERWADSPAVEELDERLVLVS